MARSRLAYFPLSSRRRDQYQRLFYLQQPGISSGASRARAGSEIFYTSRRTLYTVRLNRRSPPIHTHYTHALHLLLHIHPHQRRSISIFTILTPPAAFLGLLSTLWIYKSLMLIIFQNKIIYMPSVPPFSRSEKLEDYAAQCKPVVWREERIKAADGTQLALAVGEIPEPSQAAHLNGKEQEKGARKRRKRVVIIYFQGNGASTPPRLLALSSILHSLQTTPSAFPTKYTLLAPSYRGYWHSRGRPTERGLALDAQAALLHAQSTYPNSSSSEVRYILWGQSLGAAVAIECAASLYSTAHTTAHTNPAKEPRAGDEKQVGGSSVDGLILETPFLSIESMLLELYPQTWLPYRYLSPFLRNHWDSLSALERLPTSALPSPPPKLLLLQAGLDELVPPSHGEALETKARALGMDIRRVVARGALHNDVAGKGAGRREVVGFLREVVER